MKAVAPTTFARMSESLMSRKPLHKRLSRGFATRRSLPPIVEKNWRQQLPGGSPQGCEMPERRLRARGELFVLQPYASREGKRCVHGRASFARRRQSCTKVHEGGLFPDDRRRGGPRRAGRVRGRVRLLAPQVRKAGLHLDPPVFFAGRRRRRLAAGRHDWSL